MNECNSQPLCQEVLTVDPRQGGLPLGSAKSGQLCFHSGDCLRNEDANSLEGQSTAERFIAKEESRKRGVGAVRRGKAASQEFILRVRNRRETGGEGQLHCRGT